jgi:molybdopterin-containing oxidoreductase family iron-sulfur binding subunit
MDAIRIIPLVRDDGRRGAQGDDGRHPFHGDEIRRALDGAGGKRVAQTPSLPEGPDDPARRTLLKWMAASAALATAGCSGPPQEAIVPYAHMPEGGPGDEPVFYASAVTRAGYAQPVLVETHMGRPTKIEGNPLHPMSRGATDAQAQAAILQLWDPDRSRSVQQGDAVSDWTSARNALLDRLAGHAANGGAGLRILSGSTTSPTLERQLDALAARFPNMRRYRHDPLHDAAAEEGARRMLGYPAHALYRLDQARVIVAVGADLFMDTPAGVRYARDFAQGRGDVPAAGTGDTAPRARLYAVEAMPGLTGAMADQRWAMTPDAMGRMLRRLARALGVPGQGGTPGASGLSDVPDAKGMQGAPGLPGVSASPNLAGAAGEPGAPWESRLADELKGHAGAALVAAGPMLSADDHALVWAINAHLGGVGKSIVPVAQRSVAGMGGLLAEMHAGTVDTLLLIDVNPVHESPGSLRFADALRRVPLSVHLGLYRDETARACTWHIPRAHELENWSDALAWDGTPTILQPMIAPLHGGYSPHTVVQLLVDGVDIAAHDAVRQTWQAVWTADFETHWRAALRAGYAEGMEVAGAAGASVVVVKPARTDANASENTRAGADADADANTKAGADADAGGSAAGGAGSVAGAATSGVASQNRARGILAHLAVDPYLGGGASANNAWQQELPRPLTRLTWDNAVFMGPRTARAYNVDTGDVVRLSAAHGGTAEGPVHILQGHAEGLVTIPLGYGRRNAGRVGDGVGFDAYVLQDHDAGGMPLSTVAVTLERTGRTHSFAHVQTELSMHGRDIVRVEDIQARTSSLRASSSAAQASPAETKNLPVGTLPSPSAEESGKQHGEHAENPSLYPDVQYPDYAWAMTIDLDKCIGCNACTIACQAENNIPVVGAEQVRKGRVMHWVRVDVYRQARETLFQPVPCMHCENAPCEVVCPVGATVHDSEGLNAQVYNRCVGTRFCSNNCPYKVRRFNFFEYSDQSEDSAAHQNPDVTVRQRGVMEKCSYCVQRISRARIRSQKEDRPLRDGDVVTACEAVCPTQAIVFGNLNDSGSRVNATRRSPRAYALLEELNTRPRTRYLARQADSAAALEPDRHDQTDQHDRHGRSGEPGQLAQAGTSDLTGKPDRASGLAQPATHTRITGPGPEVEADDA